MPTTSRYLVAYLRFCPSNRKLLMKRLVVGLEPWLFDSESSPGDDNVLDCSRGAFGVLGPIPRATPESELEAGSNERTGELS